MVYELLIVEDDTFQLEVIASQLATLPVEIIKAVDASQALEQLKHHEFDVVLSDFQLPGMDGIELLRQIKEKSPKTVVLLMTAHATVENAVDALKLGAYHYFQKPLDFPLVKSLVEKIFKQLDADREREYLYQELSKFQYDNLI